MLWHIMGHHGYTETESKMSNLLKIRTKYWSWKIVILYKEAGATKPLSILWWGEGKDKVEHLHLESCSLGKLSSNQGYSPASPPLPGRLSRMCSLPSPAPTHAYQTCSQSPMTCPTVPLDCLIAILHLLPGTGRAGSLWLSSFFPCDCSAGAELTITNLSPLAVAVLASTKQTNNYKNHKFYDHLNSGTKQTNFWWIFTLLLMQLIYPYIFHEEDIDYHANYIFTLFLWDLMGQMKFLGIKDS